LGTSIAQCCQLQTMRLHAIWGRGKEERFQRMWVLPLNLFFLIYYCSRISEFISWTISPRSFLAILLSLRMLWAQSDFMVACLCRAFFVLKKVAEMFSMNFICEQNYCSWQKYCNKILQFWKRKIILRKTFKKKISQVLFDFVAYNAVQRSVARWRLRMKHVVNSFVACSFLTAVFYRKYY